MMKISKTLIPTILGVLTVLGLFEIESRFHTPQFVDDDIHFNIFAQLIFPLTIFACVVQFLLVIPIRDRFKTKGKILKLTLSQFVAFLCIIFGITFGFFLWRRQFGIRDFIIASLIGIVSFGTYFCINLWTLSLLDYLKKK
jgi:hypothetical protein